MVDDLIERASLMHRIEKWIPRDKCGQEELEDEILANLCVSMLMEIEEQPTVDAVPVVHGKWVKVNTHLWKKDEDGSIDDFAWENGFHNGPYCELCGESPCVNCNPNWRRLTCYIGHWECSECNEVSKYGKENFCPNCGVRMDEKYEANREDT